MEAPTPPSTQQTCSWTGWILTLQKDQLQLFARLLTHLTRCHMTSILLGTDFPSMLCTILDHEKGDSMGYNWDTHGADTWFSHRSPWSSKLVVEEEPSSDTIYDTLLLCRFLNLLGYRVLLLCTVLISTDDIHLIECQLHLFWKICSKLPCYTSLAQVASLLCLYCAAVGYRSHTGALLV